MTNTHTQSSKRYRLKRNITIYLTITLCTTYLSITTARLIELVQGGHYTISLSLIFQVYNTLMTVLLGYILETGEAYVIKQSTYNKIIKLCDIIDRIY